MQRRKLTLMLASTYLSQHRQPGGVSHLSSPAWPLAWASSLTCFCLPELNPMLPLWPDLVKATLSLDWAYPNLTPLPGGHSDVGGKLAPGLERGREHTAATCTAPRRDQPGSAAGDSQDRIRASGWMVTRTLQHNMEEFPVILIAWMTNEWMRPLSHPR